MDEINEALIFLQRRQLFVSLHSTAYNFFTQRKPDIDRKLDIVNLIKMACLAKTVVLPFVQTERNEAVCSLLSLLCQLYLARRTSYLKPK